MRHPAPPFNCIGRRQRPVLLVVCAAVCTLSFLGLAIYSLANFRQLAELIRVGVISPKVFFGCIVSYPVFLLWGGLLLLFMRRSALIILGSTLPWGICVAVLWGVNPFVYVGFALVLGIIGYALWLNHKGLLR